jgi:hypothetical protein
VVNLFLFLKLWIGRDILISMLVVDHFNACNILVPNLSVSKRVPSTFLLVSVGFGAR